MDLILWRHADAEDGAPDLERRLTKKGRKQAARVAEWLRKRLPEGFEVVCSPAARARETAEALSDKVRVENALVPGASPAAIIRAARWPDAAAVVLVGHQPDLGRAAAHLVTGRESEWRLQKGAAWWIESGESPLVRAVVSPDLL